jgi:hypothetical protein
MSFNFLGSCRRTKAEMLPKGEGVTGKKAGHNRLIISYPNGNKAFRLHLTDVVTLRPDGSLTLNDGGFPTKTTRTAMAEGVAALTGKSWHISGGMPRAAHVINGWRSDAKAIAFNRSITLDAQGHVIEYDYSEAEGERIKRLKSGIAKLSRKIYALDVVPVPNGGDCWLCHLVTADSGDPWGDVEHLESHVEESYLHGSLILNAMRASGYNDTGIGFYWHQANDARESNRLWARKVMARAMRKYLSKKLGLPS